MAQGSKTADEQESDNKRKGSKTSGPSGRERTKTPGAANLLRPGMFGCLWDWHGTNWSCGYGCIVTLCAWLKVHFAHSWLVTLAHIGKQYIRRLNVNLTTREIDPASVNRARNLLHGELYVISTADGVFRERVTCHSGFDGVDVCSVCQ